MIGGNIEFNIKFTAASTAIIYATVTSYAEEIIQKDENDFRRFKVILGGTLSFMKITIIAGTAIAGGIGAIIGVAVGSIITEIGELIKYIKDKQRSKEQVNLKR